MDEWLQSLVPWGTEVIVWLQVHSAPWLDSGARFFTTLGYEEFYLLVLPLVYWCLSKQAGIGLGYVSMLSAWLNSAVKYLFAIPRPSDPRIQMKAPRPETSPSFPSGHAQNAVVNWGYAALWVRRWWFTLLAAIVIVCISLSRPLLGVHFPQDIIGGWIIGLVLLAAFAWASPPVGRWAARQHAVVQVVLAVGAPLILVFLHPADTAGAYPAEGAVTPAAAMAGLGVGVIMERAWVRFRVEGALWRRIVRFLAGMVVVGILYAGPKLLLPEGMASGVDAAVRFVRYALLGCAVAFVCPWLFVRLRLAEGAGA
jgi:membrane-associated phospholipid phosphatase